MNTDWTPISTNVPRTGYWIVTREGVIDHCYFQNPNEPSFYRTEDGWLPAGWYDRNYERVSGISAWRPLLLPFGEEVTRKRKPARPGDNLGAASLVSQGETFLHIEIEGGGPLGDSILFYEAKSAIDSLFTALLPHDLDDPEVHLFRKE